MSDELFDQYVELAALDPDPATATAALCGLLEHPALTAAQVARLQPVVAGDPILEQRYRCLKPGVTRR